MAFQLYQGDPETNRYRLGWFVAPTAPGGRALNVGDGGDVQLRTGDNGFVFGEPVALSAAKWSPDSRWIAYLLKRNGKVQLWRSRIDGGKQEQLTYNDADVRNFFWDKDGARLFYTANRRSRSELRDARESEARRGYLIDDRFSPKYSLRPLRAIERTTELWVYDVDEKRQRRADETEKGDYAALVKGSSLRLCHGVPPSNSREQSECRSDVAPPALFSGGEKWIAFADVVEPEDRLAFPTAILSVVSPDDPDTRVTCKAAECRGIIERIWWGSEGREIYFLRTSVNLRHEGFYAWSPMDRTLRKVLKTDALLDKCTSKNNRLICLYSSPTQPEMFVQLDLKTGAVVPLIDLNPEFQNIRYTDGQWLEWSNKFGDKTFGYLMKPRNYDPGKRYPLVVLTYRATGFLLSSTGGEYPAHLLAENGFMVLVFNRPFSMVWKEDRYKNDFQDNRNVQASLEAGIDLLESRGLIDPARVAITGLSNGTAIAFFALTHSRRHFAAAIVSSDTSGEPLAYYLTSSGNRRALREKSGLVFSKEGPDRTFYAGLAPSQNVEKIETPILFNLPDTEVLVSMQTIVTLQEYGRPFEAYVFRDEYHIKWQPAHRYAIFRRNLQWLQFWLQDKQADDPMDLNQYARWQKLREQHRTRAKMMSGRIGPSMLQLP